MQFTDFSKLDLSRLPTPCFVVDEVAIERNLRILRQVADASGAKVLSALKAFSMWRLAPLVSRYLDGTCASGLHEARLGSEYYGGEVHVFSAAYSEASLAEILLLADHVVFNSCSQWVRFQPLITAARASRPQLQFGLRINPEHSEGAVPIYDPCAPGSRLGIPLSQLDEAALDGISGLHFHTLCEQDFPPLQRTLDAVEEKFGHLLGRMAWVNFGGGHHISRPGYQVADLVARIRDFSAKYKVQVYLEPGEAVAIGSGVLIAQVLDLTWSGLNQAILDTSATCHAGHAGNALPPRHPRRWRSRRTAPHLPARRPHLPGGRCDRGLQFCRTAAGRPAPGIRGYGPLHHGKDLHLQRYAVAVHRPVELPHRSAGDRAGVRL